jgi:Predicted ABC-type transport system involved in lysophospholipase L1 biosynthesis, permease component
VFSRANIRKALVSIQLTISIVLVAAVFAVNHQLQFIRHANLGLNLDNTLLINGPVMSDNTYVEKFEPFKSELMSLAGIEGVTYASSFPGKEINWHRSDITITSQKDLVFDSRVVSIGTEFLDFFAIPLLTGRNFNDGLNVDQKSMLLNEEASRMFGFEAPEQAIGEIISMGPRNFEIIGVIKNYHFRSFKHALQPMLFMKGYPRAPTYAVKFKPDEIIHLIPKIEEIWKSVYGDNVFSYEFLDENFEKEYASEALLQKIIRVLTSFALLIAFAGMCGLSVYSVNQRIREIAIRRVFGASTARILAHLTTDYLVSVASGITIGLAISSLLLNRWLEYYAYKMDVNWMFYAWPGLIVSPLIAMAVGLQYLVSFRKKSIATLRRV